MNTLSLAQSLIQSQKLNQSLFKYNQKEKQDFIQIQSDIEASLQIFKKKFFQCQTNLQQIQVQWDKVKKFTSRGPGFLKAKLEEINSKTKNIDAVINGLKQTVSKIKPQKLILLPVNKQPSLTLLFKTLFQVLYHKNPLQFQWESFKSLVLEFQNGQDFISRLVNVHFRDFKADQYQALLILKNDQQFDKTVVNSKYSHDIIDLADWLEYVCVGHQFSIQKNEAQKAYDKIRKDIHRRQGTSVQASKKFWKQALQEVDKFQMSLLNYNAQIKAFQILTDESLQNLEQRLKLRAQQLKETKQ